MHAISLGARVTASCPRLSFAKAGARGPTSSTGCEVRNAFKLEADGVRDVQGRILEKDDAGERRGRVPQVRPVEDGRACSPIVDRDRPAVAAKAAAGSVTEYTLGAGHPRRAGSGL